MSDKNNLKKRKPSSVTPLTAMLVMLLSLLCLLTALYFKDRELNFILDRYNTLRENIPSAENTKEQEPLKTPLPPPPTLKPTPPVPKDLSAVGTLFIDRTNGNHIISMGRNKGLESGDILNVYSADGNLAARARVTLVKDKISEADLLDTDPSAMNGDYFEVRFK